MTRLDSIMVSANKQAQPLDSVNGTVQVKTGEELEEAGVETVQDLEKVFSGLLIRTRGNRAYAGSTIRAFRLPITITHPFSFMWTGFHRTRRFLPSLW